MAVTGVWKAPVGAAIALDLCVRQDKNVVGGNNYRLGRSTSSMRWLSCGQVCSRATLKLTNVRRCLGYWHPKAGRAPLVWNVPAGVRSSWLRVQAVNVDVSRTADAGTSGCRDAVVLDVEGMMCGGCVARVRNLLSADDRVESAAVNILTETAAIRIRTTGGSGDKSYASVANELAARLSLSGFPSKQRVAGAGNGSATKKREEMALKKEDLIRKSTGQVVFAWTLVALCCGTHAAHFAHTLGFHGLMSGMGKTPSMA